VISHNTKRPDLSSLLYVFLTEEHGSREGDLHRLVLEEFSQSSHVSTFVLNRMVEKQTDFGLASLVARSEQLTLYLFSIATDINVIQPIIRELSVEKILASPSYTPFLTRFCMSNSEVKSCLTDKVVEYYLQGG
jgi:hypothetical protein